MIYTKHLSKLIKLSSSQKLIFATTPWLRGIDHMKHLEAENEKLIEALGRIARWNEIGLKKRCDIGSHGVRDHYIAIAQKALKQSERDYENERSV